MSELLPVSLKNYVQHYVKKDELLSNHLAQGKHILLISCTLRVPRPIKYQSIPLDKDPRVKLVGDLTTDRYPPKAVTVAADLTLSLQARRRSNRLTIDPDDEVQTTGYLGDAEEEEALKWCRVGNVNILDDDGATFCAKRSARFGECVSYINPLIASYDPQSGEVLLYTLHAYDFMDFVVGNLEERQAWSKLGASVELLGLFGNPRLTLESKEELAESVTKYLEEDDEDEADEEEDVWDGLPFLPTFCYNTYHAEDFGLGVERWPRNGIDLVVRCVNHYTPKRDMQNLEFPRDIRLSIWKDENMEDLFKDVLQHINVAGLQDGVKVTSNKLFHPSHKGKWSIDWWVMPQTQRKLFRYTQGKLDQFLDPSMATRVEDKRLYCEAHIVPKTN